MKKIKAIAIENTTLCGADCIMCPRHDFEFKKECMPFDLFCRAVDESVNCGVEFINMCGFGDSAMDKNFINELRYIKETYPNVNIGTTSTCHLIKDELLDAVCDYVDEIQVSMYGITPDTYESIHRGGLKYDKVKKNIDDLLDRDKRPSVVLEYLFMEENKRELDEWIRYYEGKADRVDVWRLQNWAGWLPNEDRDRPFKKCFRISSLNGLYIRADGQVSMCCQDYNRRLTVGNVFYQHLSDILDSDEVKELQNMNEDGRIRDYSICANCDQLHEREDALIYTSDKTMSVGKHSLFKDGNIYDV